MTSTSSGQVVRVAMVLTLVSAPSTTWADAPAPVDQEAPESSVQWQPPPPLPSDTTWIRLDSGEWLKGSIGGLDKGSLDFTSDRLGGLQLAWDAIVEIRSTQALQLALEDGSVVSGVLQLADGQIRLSPDREAPLAPSEVLSITTAADGGRDAWSGEVVAGLNIRSGNTEQTDFTGRANAVRRTPKDRITLDYLGNVSDTEEARITDNHRASGEWARLKSKRFFWTPLYGEYFRDPFQNIADRTTLGTGVGYLILDTSRTTC